jgi:hypothetical protein
MLLFHFVRTNKAALQRNNRSQIEGFQSTRSMREIRRSLAAQGFELEAFARRPSRAPKS